MIIHRHFRLFIFSLLLSFSLLPVGAAAQARVAPAPAQAGAAASAAETTTDFTTANGLKTVHRYVKGNEIVAVQIYFRGGSRNITAKNAGIETLMWEVAQLGTRNFSKGVINRDLARMGTIISSGGGYDYSVIAMQCVQKNFDRSWQLLTDMVLNPLFDEKETALERDKIVNGLRQEADDPDTYVSTLSDRLMYAAHPYLNRPYGTVESVSALTAAELKAYHATQLQTSHMLAVVVGNISADEIKRKVELTFGKLPKGDYKPEPLPNFAHAGKPDFQVSERGVPTSYVRGVFAAPAPGDKDYPAMTVLTNILSQQFFEEVRVKRNLSYAPYAEINSTGANTGFIYVTTPKPNDAIRVMYAEIERMQQNRIREKPLQDIINGFLTQYYQKLETNSAQASRLGEYELLGGGWRRALTWIEDVRKVTPDDLQRVANTYLRNFHFAVIGDARAFDRSLFLSK